MKHLTILTLLLIPFTIPAFADDATQTDWSGGDGIPGPVSDWGDDFDMSTDISWLALPGELHLSSTPKASIRHNVSDNSFSYSVCSADIDDDGDTDIIGVSDGGGIIWCENDNGSGTSWTEHTVASGMMGWMWTVGSADMDGDGDMDILGADFGADYVIWWENDDGSGTSWTEHTVDFFDGATSVYAVDIDGDDDLDIVGGGHWDERIVWWENDDGSGTSWTEHIVDTYFGSTHSVYSADIDGDGDMDIIGGACSGDTTWWENDDGYGTSWTKHIVEGNYSAAVSVYSEDMDGDGDMDVLAARFGPSANWWENDDGSGTNWTMHIIDADCSVTSVYAADVDGDGDMDALAVGSTPITWWENADGFGTSWIKHTVDGSFSSSYPAVCSADIDGDGGMDVLGINSDNIAWWEVTEFKPSGDLVSSIFDTGGTVNDWGSINWTCDVTMVTTVTIEVRASNDPGNMGNWVTVTSPGDDLSNYIADGTRYFQYRVSLTSGDTDISPTFEDIVVSWDWVGIDGDERENLRYGDNNLPKIFALNPAAPNPSSGSATIGFALPRACEVELSLYNIKGRKVATLAEGTYQPGEYSATVSGLSSGVYVYSIIAGEFSDSKKMVVK